MSNRKRDAQRSIAPGKIYQDCFKNYTKPCWALKCDIKKFFATIDHKVLLDLLSKKIKDPNILWLLSEIIDSFHSEFGEDKGVPLGNLTSQIFANIYLDELDQFIKHQLRIKYYLRYADDFLMLGESKGPLDKYLEPIRIFLNDCLKLELHPRKIIFRKLEWGIDFLGYVTLPHYRLSRTKTRRRISEQLKEKAFKPNFHQSLQSYLGYLSHANSHKLIQKIIDEVWLLD